MSEYFDDLIQAGFINRDFSWNLSTGKNTKHSHYRITDNFIRFYLKFLAPNIDRIHAGLMVDESPYNLPGWHTTMGIQFENLINNNIQTVLSALNISPGEVINFGPFFQNTTKKMPGCQIDLLIQTKANLLYLCEIRFSKNKIPLEVISQVKGKIENLQKPKGMSCLPILIHVNGVSEEVSDSGFFYHIIDFGDFCWL